jgi:hypothetical protein
MWRSVGFLMNFSVVLELATFVAFAVVLLGGRSNRDNGWKMCVGLLAVVVVCQIAAMGIVVSFFCIPSAEIKSGKLTMGVGFPVRP